MSLSETSPKKTRVYKLVQVFPVQGSSKKLEAVGDSVYIETDAFDECVIVSLPNKEMELADEIIYDLKKCFSRPILIVGEGIRFLKVEELAIVS